MVHRPTGVPAVVHQEGAALLHAPTTIVALGSDGRWNVIQGGDGGRLVCVWVAQAGLLLADVMLANGGLRRVCLVEDGQLGVLDGYAANSFEGRHGLVETLALNHQDRVF